MPDATQTFTAAVAIQGLLLGMMLGSIGQGIRIIVGLKKANDAAQASGSTLKDEFDAARLLVSLLIGAIAGGLAALPFLSQLANLNYQICVALLGAGYAGSDFIEGFMSKTSPGANADATPAISPALSAPRIALGQTTTPAAIPLPALNGFSVESLSVPQDVVHQVTASSFADPADVDAFRKCKAQGKTDHECFKVGDNGIGFMGDDCTTTTPMCALPVEDWMQKWGSKQAARLKPILVVANGKSVICLMGDTMPHRADITNGAGIDLSPAAVAALGLKPPIMDRATWCWLDHVAPPASSSSLLSANRVANLAVTA